MSHTDAPLPAAMQAIEIAGPGGPEMLRPTQRPIPLPGPGEVLIRVAAAGINRPDVLQRQGLYPMPPGVTDLPGLEVAGTVVMLGAGTERWQLGDRVSALLPGGGYAAYAAAHGTHCLPWPETLSAAEAAALPETVFTVWTNLFEDGRLAPGQRALVHGGSSGIGTTAIQMIRAFGASVAVTAGTAAKCEACLALGAEAAINYRDEDAWAQLKRAGGPAGFDVVLDMVGGDYLLRNLALLAPGGRHVSIAALRGQIAELPIGLMMMKRLTLTGSTLRPRAVEEKARIAAAVETVVWPWIAAGRLRPLIDQTFPLTAAAEAHARMDASAHTGKLVLLADAATTA